MSQNANMTKSNRIRSQARTPSCARPSATSRCRSSSATGLPFSPGVPICNLLSRQGVGCHSRLTPYVTFLSRQGVGPHHVQTRLSVSACSAGVLSDAIHSTQRSSSSSTQNSARHYCKKRRPANQSTQPTAARVAWVSEQPPHPSPRARAPTQVCSAQRVRFSDPAACGGSGAPLDLEHKLVGRFLHIGGASTNAEVERAINTVPECLRLGGILLKTQGEEI